MAGWNRTDSRRRLHKSASLGFQQRYESNSVGETKSVFSERKREPGYHNKKMINICSLYYIINIKLIWT